MTETNGAGPKAATAEVGEKDAKTPCAEGECRYRLVVYQDATGNEFNLWDFDSLPTQYEIDELNVIGFQGKYQGQPAQVSFNVRHVHSWAVIPVHEAKSTP